MEDTSLSVGEVLRRTRPNAMCILTSLFIELMLYEIT